jgi:hypothetical protein
MSRQQSYFGSRLINKKRLYIPAKDESLGFRGTTLLNDLGRTMRRIVPLESPITVGCRPALRRPFPAGFNMADCGGFSQPRIPLSARMDNIYWAVRDVSPFQ